ncbi:NAD(P)-binding protein [Desemzia sp. FAM 23991]|uniref:glycosyl-4,4'-diaponeurosporenoate acyltransferase CrtO family protein n=1 Tax=unclassified Desemzia TaxID=2685243 RepID=UPI0038839666
METKKTVSVIGAGVAGLASAMRLQHAGYNVELFEKEGIPGGKMNLIEKDGYRFDLGPSLVMMPDLYREVFELTGRDPDDYIPMERLDPMYTAHFNGGKEQFDVSSDLVTLTKTLEEFSAEDAQGFMHYLKDIYERFVVAKDHFLQRPFRNQSDFYRPSVIKQALKLKTFDSADHMIKQYVKDERLQQMLSFQTLYIGLSPKNGPLFISWIARQIPIHFFVKHQDWFKTKNWENSGDIWQRWFRVRNWKPHLPDGTQITRKGFDKRTLRHFNQIRLERFIIETRRGELAHWMMIPPAFLFFLWNPLWAGWVMVIYAVIVNLPFIIVQRYNRPRLEKLGDRKERKFAKNS